MIEPTKRQLEAIARAQGDYVLALRAIARRYAAAPAVGFALLADVLEQRKAVRFVPTVNPNERRLELLDVATRKVIEMPPADVGEELAAATLAEDGSG